MSTFGETEDWGLQAIVGGPKNMDMMDTNKQEYSLGFLGIGQNEDGDDDQDFLFSLPDYFVKSSMPLDDGLEALYKPFYPILDSIATQSYNVLSPKESTNDLDEVQGEQELVETPACAPSSRKRKSQQKRVVNKVKAEDLSSSSDMWAWRKYGQKPIKGSHYPRSYYRCSTMKGCLARKQVEQSHADPGIYIVTYTAEHCHSQPARRNSLAGTVRQKFPTPNNKSPTEAGGSQTSTIHQIVVKDSNSSENEMISPTSRGNMESFDESNTKQQKLGDSEDQMIQSGYTNSNQFCFSDFQINDDFFCGLLEDLDDARDSEHCHQL